VIGPLSNKLAMAKHIVCTFASSQVGSSMGVTRVLGVHMRNMKNVYERKLLLDISSQDFWITIAG
jgi:hypothetical protein